MLYEMLWSLSVLCFLLVIANGLQSGFGSARFTTWSSWLWWLSLLDGNNWKRKHAQTYTYIFWEHAADSWHKSLTCATVFKSTTHADPSFWSSHTPSFTSSNHLFFIPLLDNRQLILTIHCFLLFLFVLCGWFNWCDLNVADKPFHILRKPVSYLRRIWHALPHPQCQSWR